MDRSWYRIALRGVSRATSTRSLLVTAAALGVFLSAASPVLAQSVCNQTGGTAPTATGGSAFACGDGATASGGLGTAFGTDSSAAGGNAVAVGGLSNASGEFTTALGRSATSSGDATTAVGFNSAATGNNSVAVGANSVADQDDTVSMGAAGAERRITNVSAGTAGTDGVNVSQLNDTAATTLNAANTYTDEQADATLIEANTYADQVAGDTLTAANTYTDQQVDQIGGMASGAAAALEQFRAVATDRFAGIDSRLNAMDESLRAMDKRISRQAAMTAALVQSSGMPDVGENYLGAGAGWSEGENAFAASFRRRFTKHFTASVGGARSGDETSVGVGAGFSW
ncbi:YadA-like family protein [uncultured Stenotrophomonas sp.]|uniref:YadA-like family protein n=1 Tax=uncultured Stenotrophomonas sp. TaxID=165438 RepID=UPI0028D83ED0|nr:YadA-like family protein [uncultured Stenotrophomonas sp.]